MSTEWERVTADDLIHIPEKDENMSLLLLIQELDFIYNLNDKIKNFGKYIDKEP